MLDNRLKTCADMVGGRGIVCDVGTDHGYLAVELIKSEKCKKVIASDIKEGPLNSAKKTVERAELSDSINLVLSDGLKNVPLDGVSDIVIAGMGGETIADIIESSICDIPCDAKLIIQPMTKAEILRERLYKSGWCICEERIAEESGKVYVIIKAEKSIHHKVLTEYEALRGFYEVNNETEQKYLNSETDRIRKISESLEKAGKISESVHFSALSSKLSEGEESISIDLIHSFLNSIYPESLQEKWDNSGIIVRGDKKLTDKVLLTLDITNSVIDEAIQKDVKLIISHHPVIFNPIKRITADTPVYKLIRNDISAICFHTNLDIAEGGTNSVIVEMLRNKLKINSCSGFEDCGNGNFLGYVMDIEPIDAVELGIILKSIFRCGYVRMNNAIDGRMIDKIAVCSGSGGSMLGLADNLGCDALITGDVKHDVWIDANNTGMGIYDCGHFHTENPVLWELRKVLETKFPRTEFIISENSSDPVKYI